MLGFQELGDGENDALACVNAVGNWSVHGEKNKPRVVMNVSPRGIEIVKYNNQEVGTRAALHVITEFIIPQPK